MGDPAGERRAGPDLSGQEPVERFHPTSGLFVGLTGLVVTGIVVVYVVASQHTTTGLRIGAGALLAGVLIWVTQVRPRVTAYRELMVMHGSLSDTVVPYVLVDQVVLTQTLNVFVGERRLVCVGIGRSMSRESLQRSRASTRGPGSGRLGRLEGSAERTHPTPTYADLVHSRLTELVDARKRAQTATAPPTDTQTGAPDGRPPRVTRRVAVPEVVAVLGSALLLVVSLLV